jgi:hypothetical protein
MAGRKEGMKKDRKKIEGRKERKKDHIRIGTNVNNG